MEERDLEQSRRIFRVAFGTFLGVPDPENFRSDRDYYQRWHSDPMRAIVAEDGGHVVGSNLGTNWGSFGFFGPLTVHPDYWNQQVGKALIGPVLDILAARGARDMGLYTFSNSPKHAGLYQSFGFWPRFLTAIMTKKPASVAAEFSLEATLDVAQFCDTIHAGLDVSAEVQAVRAQRLGKTIFIDGGFAVCHVGEGTEAGRSTCYVKFAASEPRAFDRLLNAIESFAASQDCQVLEVGVNLSRIEAYQAMLQRGFRTLTQGVAMHRPNQPLYNRPGVYVLDDWR